MQFLYSNNGHNYYAEQETGISVFYINISLTIVQNFNIKEMNIAII